MTVAIVLHRAGGAPVATPFRRAAFGTDDFVGHREIAWEGPDSMIVGRTSFVGELEVASFPHIETIVVVEGELILTAAGTSPMVLGPQAGAVIGCGTALRIQTGSGVRFSFCAAACDKPTKPGLVPLRADADFKPSASLPAEALLGPAPQCRSDNVFSSDGVDYRAGTWVRPHTTGLIARIARTSSCICWPGVYDSPRPMAACCRRAPETRFSCPRAHLSGGKATIAWRSFSWSKASKPDVERDPSCPLARSLSFRPHTQRDAPSHEMALKLQPTSPL
ncbi:hypothetical protein NKJ88_30785 [Mesorhizobium sp. M0016]